MSSTAGPQEVSESGLIWIKALSAPPRHHPPSLLSLDPPPDLQSNKNNNSNTPLKARSQDVRDLPSGDPVCRQLDASLLLSRPDRSGPARRSAVAEGAA